MRDIQEHRQLIARGLALIASQPQTPTQETKHGLEPIFADIQQRLRVPMVNQPLRALAHYPQYLASLWQHFSEAIGSNSFEAEADQLREKALLESATTIDSPGWDKLEEIASLRAYTDTMFYVLPKLLLVCTIFYEASFRGIAPARRRPQAETNNQPLPLGIAAGSMAAPATGGKVSEKLKRLLETIREKHQQPLVPSFYQSLVHWPLFLEKAWAVLDPLIGTTAYENLKEFLSEQALMGSRKLALTPCQLPDMPEQQLEELKAILLAFRDKLIPEMLIEVTLVKALLDGPEEAFSSRFSAAAGEDEEE